MSGVEQPPDVPSDVVESVYATNVLGVIHMTQAVLPIFKRRGKGDVIFIGSIAGREPYVGGTVSQFSNAQNISWFGTSCTDDCVDLLLKQSRCPRLHRRPAKRAHRNQNPRYDS